MNFTRDPAKGLFILALLSMVVLLVSMAILSDAGMESLILIVPWYLMVLVHATAGPASALLALIQKRRGFAALIVVYLMTVGAVHLHWFGVTEEVAEQVKLEYLEQMQPADHELVLLIDRRDANPQQVARPARTPISKIGAVHHHFIARSSASDLMQ